MRVTQISLQSQISKIKYAHDGDLERAYEAVLKQIEYTKYEEDLEDDGVENILK